MPESQEIGTRFPVPDWLNADYVQSALRKYHSDDKLIVLSLVCKPATAAGENYASVMMRILVEFNDGNGKLNKTNCLVKTTHESDDLVADLLKPYGIYTREIDMYELILPKLANMMHEFGGTEKLFADTIYVERERGVIIFEDLSLENYVTSDRVARLDITHAKMALRKLAVFHATAAVLNERSPGIFAKNFDCGFFTRRTEKYKPIHMALLKSLIRYIETEPKLKAKYHDKLVALMENHMEYGARVYDVEEDDFMTLSHGDFWTTNIMFRYDAEKKPQDVMLIDFQFSSWCSPAVDLHYFFNSSLREELREHNQMELVQYYYNNLVDSLQKYNYKGRIPSLFKFNLEFQARYYLALFTSFVFQPVMVYKGPELCTIRKILADDEDGLRLKDSVFANKAVREYIHKLLPVFDSRGLLDPME